MIFHCVCGHCPEHRTKVSVERKESEEMLMPEDGIRLLQEYGSLTWTLFCFDLAETPREFLLTPITLSPVGIL